MLNKLKKLLSSKLDSAAAAAAIGEIDLDALRAAHDEAVRRRSALLLSGTDADILAAELEADAARLAVDRAEAALAELEKRRVEAEEAEAKAAIHAEYEAAVAKVDAALAKIEAEYPPLAAKIVELVELADEADGAAEAWSRRYFGGATDGLPLVPTVMERLDLHNRWMVNRLSLGNGTRLLPVGTFEGHGVDWQSTELHYAVHGNRPPAVPAHQFV